ncbi:hypothetical protein HXX76_006921 [Chlamydomonas incerta]|uniref:Uncharacterized protein n=1 Tax=Chlamydomonas incerta TaxID=51695 RepID=A0A835T8G5_CHLIN|nr:hypothetical protein HXX76_006921 [Chlamydomonas incerta]|eukprot:KAG2435724.1 hypothetical protein HXX76_006921 [Chlamydomonas incerta]
MHPNTEQSSTVEAATSTEQSSTVEAATNTEQSSTAEAATNTEQSSTVEAATNMGGMMKPSILAPGGVDRLVGSLISNCVARNLLGSQPTS